MGAIYEERRATCKQRKGAHLIAMIEGIASAKAEGILVRPLQKVQEMGIAVDLQRQVWGYAELDTVPDQIFVVARESGGQVLAAFHEDKPVGFALAFVGAHHGTAYLHSHMVGVLPDYRDRGVGRLLKLAQRDDALARGFDLIEWTFDPLQLKNAHFNLARLGAIVRRYLPNFYGRTSSPLHAGLPTDRLVAEWWIRSSRVEAVLAAQKPKPHPRRSRISIPSNIRDICSTAPIEAENIQTGFREQFQEQTAAEYAAVGFEFDEQQASYLLEPYED
jgi:predicted GNAT superfamily acetyltransferase